MIKSKYKEGKKIVFFFLFVFYVLPFFYHIFNVNKVEALYNVDDNFFAILVLPLIILSVLILLKVPEKKSIFSIGFLNRFFSNTRISAILIFVLLILSVNFFLNFDISFRHKTRMSEGGMKIYILFLLSAYSRMYVFYLVLIKYLGNKITKEQRFLSLLITISSLLKLNSSFDAIYIFVSFLMAIGKEGFLFSRKKKKNDMVKSFLSKKLKYVQIIVLVLSVLYIGIVNKIGVRDFSQVFINIEFVYHKLMLRLSTHYMSLVSVTTQYFEDSSYIFKTYEGILQTNENKIIKLIGDGTYLKKPELWSINRTNYLFLFRYNYGEFTGASPGVITSIYYLPFNILINVLLIASYISIIIRRISKFFYTSKFEVNLFSCFILMFFIMPLFESPVNMLNVLSTEIFYFLFFLGATTTNIKIN